MQAPTQKSHRRLVIILVLGVLFMFGFCYMLVPLYELVCKEEGINGKSAKTASLYDSKMQVDQSRTIKVYFSTTLHGALSFKFIPLQRSIDIHPGERKLIYFFAENKTGHEMTVQAIPSITPTDGARFLKKTECFCFTQQYFFKGEKADMPVYFFIDPAISKDIKEMTLSYTLFDAAGYVKKEEHFTKGRIDLS
ncbi:MAG: Cytochrome c oxidase, assembly transmembrane protein CoxG [uncultured bacterium]|nr:MAG: Cytochrome c oxidase, assembly transmembrane protein CoxG [uncultured bacterium]